MSAATWPAPSLPATTFQVPAGISPAVQRLPWEEAELDGAVLGALEAVEEARVGGLADDELAGPTVPWELDELDDAGVLLTADVVDPVAAGALLAELEQPAVSAAAPISPETAKTEIRFMDPPSRSTTSGRRLVTRTGCPRAEDRKLLSERSEFPQPDRAVLRGAREEPAVGAEGDAECVFRVTGQRLEALRRVRRADVVHPHLRAHAAPVGRHPAVGAEGHAGRLVGLADPADDHWVRGIRHAAQDRRVVARPRRHELAAGVEGDVEDPVGVPGADAERFGRGAVADVPHPPCSV